MKGLRISRWLSLNPCCHLLQFYVGISKLKVFLLATMIMLISMLNPLYGMTNQEKLKKDAISAAVANPNLEERIEALVLISNQCNASERFGLLPIMAKTYFNLGRIENAKEYALLMLDVADNHKENWAYGDVIHDSNMILGLVELHNGNIEKAKSYLLKAGDTPGSYLIQHLGPNMMLAKALLDLGEQGIVLEYLSRIKTVWTERNERLIAWEKDLAAGIQPDFSGNLAP